MWLLLRSVSFLFFLLVRLALFDGQFFVCYLCVVVFLHSLTLPLPHTYSLCVLFLSCPCCIFLLHMLLFYIHLYDMGNLTVCVFYFRNVYFVRYYHLYYCGLSCFRDAVVLIYACDIAWYICIYCLMLFGFSGLNSTRIAVFCLVLFLVL